jgi:simple sugar transport system substrate-binding protein
LALFLGSSPKIDLPHDKYPIRRQKHNIGDRHVRQYLKKFAFAFSILGISTAAVPPAQAQGTADQNLRIVVVTHGQSADPFWSIVKNGATQAGKDAHVEVEYRAPESFDMVAMSKLIDGAVNQHPAGIVVSIPDADALAPSIKRAIAAGIPVVSINAGIDAAGRLGVPLHVGQEEITAGRIVGQKLKALGGKHALCVNQEVGNAALDKRCQGFAQGFGSVTVLPTSLDPSEIQAKIRAALSSDRSIDTVLALAAVVGEPAVAAVQSAGLAGKVHVASFDLSPRFLNDVLAGKADFAVDQQPFLQGYLPVQDLALNVRYGTMPVGQVLTGPNLITKDKAKQVLDLAAKGLR